MTINRKVGFFFGYAHWMKGQAPSDAKRAGKIKWVPFPRYNDCWPCTRSWTIVDYYLRATPSFYHVKRGFASVNTAVVQDKDCVSIFGINDLLMSFTGSLRYGIFTFGGKYVIDKTVDIEISENSSEILARIDTKHINDSNGVPFAILYDDQGKLVARDRLINDVYYKLPLLPPNIDITIGEGQFKFASPVFVMGVCLDLTGEQKLEDNMFDLYPGMEYSVLWNGDKPQIKWTLNSFFDCS